MPAKLKYGEPTQMISIRVPQSRKEEIRELVRGVLNGDDGWVSVEDALPENDTRLLLWIDNNLHPHWSGERLGSYLNNKFYGKSGIDTSCETVTHYQILPQPPKSK